MSTQTVLWIFAALAVAIVGNVVCRLGHYLVGKRGGVYGGRTLDMFGFNYGLERGGKGPWWSPFSEADWTYRERIIGAVYSGRAVRVQR